MTLGNAIRRRRKELGYSQREFAEMIGWKQGKLSLLECGKRPPEFPTLVKLACYLEAAIVIYSDNTVEIFPDFDTDI